MPFQPFPLKDGKTLPFTVQEWFRKINIMLDTGSFPWTLLDFANSNITDIQTRNHNDLQTLQGGTSGQYYHLTSAQNTQIANLVSGTYTPTLTNVANVSIFTAYQCQYFRIGNIVTVSGKVDLSPSSTSSTQLGLTLPIASNIANENELAGTANNGTFAGSCAVVRGDATNNRAEILYVPQSTSSQSLFFIFSYQVL